MNKIAASEDGSRYTSYLNYVDHSEHIEDDMRSAFEHANVEVPDEALLYKLVSIAQAYGSRAVSNYVDTIRRS